MIQSGLSLEYCSSRRLFLCGMAIVMCGHHSKQQEGGPEKHCAWYVDERREGVCTWGLEMAF